jgi:hypothetical protein
MYTQKEYLQSIGATEEWSRYDSPGNLKQVLALLDNEQWIPSRVSVQRAIRQLGLRRTDGGSAARDQALADLAAQRKFDALVKDLVSVPLQRSEVEEFASLSFHDLQKRYWANGGLNSFRPRYDKACVEHGFRVPEKPTDQLRAETEAIEGELKLDEAAYHALSAQEVARRYLAQPAFKRAVDKLIAEKKI